MNVGRHYFGCPTTTLRPSRIFLSKRLGTAVDEAGFELFDVSARLTTRVMRVGTFLGFGLSLALHQTPIFPEAHSWQFAANLTAFPAGPCRSPTAMTGTAPPPVAGAKPLKPFMVLARLYTKSEEAVQTVRDPFFSLSE